MDYRLRPEHQRSHTLNRHLCMMMAGYGNPLGGKGGNFNCPRALICPPEVLQDLALPMSRLKEWEAMEPRIANDHKAAAKRLFFPGGVIDILVR